MADHKRYPEGTFSHWWWHTGSGIPPLPGHDHEEHAYRVTRLAWAACAASSRPKPIPRSERLPRPEETDVGRCYWGRQFNDLHWSWTFSLDPQGDTHWLPAGTEFLPAKVEQ